MPVICSLSRCLFSTLWWLIPPSGLSSVQPMAALAHAGKRHFTTCLPSASSSSYHSSSWSPATAGYSLRSPRKWQKTAVSFILTKTFLMVTSLFSLQVTWPCGVFALTLLRVICHANVLLLLWSLSHSAVQQSAAAQVEKQHPQGTHAHAEDDCGHCAVIHGVLDTLLHAWPVVLVLSRWPGGNSVPVPLTHPFYIRPVKCLFGPHHLWSLHHSTMHEA